MNTRLVTGFALLAICWGTLETGFNLFNLATTTEMSVQHVSRMLLPIVWLAAGIGFYRRKESARKVVVGLLALSVVFNVVICLYSGYMAFSALQPPPEFADWPEAAGIGGQARTAAFAAMVASGIGVAICAWLFRKFQTPDIRREFA